MAFPAGLELLTEAAIPEATEVLSNAIAGTASNDPELNIEWMLGPEFKGKWDDEDRKTIHDYLARMTVSGPTYFHKVVPQALVVAARTQDGKIGAVMSAQQMPVNKCTQSCACCLDCGALCRMMGAGILPPWRKKCSDRLKAQGPLIEKRMQTMAKFTESLHEKDAPTKHWYLALVGVDTKYQGQGLGSKLLKFLNAQADADKMACYLQCMGPRNHKIYERYGYKVVGEPHRLEEAGEEKFDNFWSMVRPASGNS